MQVIVEPKGTFRSIAVTEYNTYGTLRATWKYKQMEVHLYAKTKGRNPNQFDFPPPADQELFFGKCLLVNPAGDLTIDDWTQLYEGIMQFEDLHSEEESEEEVVENCTKEGYEKDGFVVSDSELEEEPYIAIKN